MSVKECYSIVSVPELNFSACLNSLLFATEHISFNARQFSVYEPFASSLNSEFSKTSYRPISPGVLGEVFSPVHT